MKYNESPRSRKKGFKSIVLICGEVFLFCLLLILNLSPILWAGLTSFKPLNVIFEFPPRIFGFRPTLEHYINVAHNQFFRAMRNSFFYSVGAIVCGLILSLFAAYGFQRYQFRLKRLLFFFVVAGIPVSVGSTALLIPSYLIFSSIGLTNKWSTLIILYTAYNLPMGIWIVKGGIERVPVEIEEAAMIDGSSRFFILFRMMPVLIRPSIAAAAMFIFIASWNEFIASMVMIDSPSLRSVQVVIYNFLGYYGQEWGPLTASAWLALVPTLLVFTFLGKLLISGLTQGSVKE
jgi:multiple sugar transport system permease protein